MDYRYIFALALVCSLKSKKPLCWLSVFWDFKCFWTISYKDPLRVIRAVSFTTEHLKDLCICFHTPIHRTCWLFIIQLMVCAAMSLCTLYPSTTVKDFIFVFFFKRTLQIFTRKYGSQILNDRIVYFVLYTFREEHDCRQQYHLNQGCPVRVLEGHLLLVPCSNPSDLLQSEYLFVFYRSLLFTYWFK